jgi:hypothetical protein
MKLKTQTCKLSTFPKQMADNTRQKLTNIQGHRNERKQTLKDLQSIAGPQAEATKHTQTQLNNTNTSEPWSEGLYNCQTNKQLQTNSMTHKQSV